MAYLQRLWWGGPHPEVLPLQVHLTFCTCPVAAGQVTGPSPLDTALQESAVVGRCPEVQVSIRGRTVPCVLDTGSQVTLFSQSFFQRHFGSEKLWYADDLQWLTLNAANRSGSPLWDFNVGGIDVPGQAALIVEDQCISSDHGLLGMNVIAGCWEGITQRGALPFG